MSTQTTIAPRATLEQLIMEAVRAIRFGSVEITIHDSRVVQIERTEKLRLNGR
ncbi:MAG TPA: YezD family protein [Longimicrobium sp.]|nr:YezD family protein [Longimicrobium sp.]